jgi:flagellar biosynthesis protein FlhA
LGRPAIWIRPQQADRAGARGCKVLTPVQLLADHLRAVLRRHAWELLSRQQVATMVADLRARCPSLVDEVAARFRMGVIHKVLQGLLREAVGVHDLETILEAMSDWPGESEDIALVGEHVRGSLARTLSQKLCSSDGKLWCVALSATWEDELAAHVERQAQGDLDAADRDLSHRLTESLREGLAQLRRQGRKPVVLCSPAVRKAAWRLIAPAETEAAVLAYNEIDSVEVKTLSSIGIEP